MGRSSFRQTFFEGRDGGSVAEQKVLNNLADSPALGVMLRKKLCLRPGECAQGMGKLGFKTVENWIHGREILSQNQRVHWKGMMDGIRFLWRATRGYRLRPWRSPYLRWRLETYSGKKAETIEAKDFLTLMLGEWKQVLRFSKWLGQMRGYAREEGES
jgi:hypothetical protein